MDLNGKNIIITGGAGGIGAATTHLLLESGANIGVVDNNSDSLWTLKKSLSSYPENRVNFYSIHIGQFDLVVQTVNMFFSRYGSIDGLINNAAILKDGPLISISKGEFKKYSLSDWDETIASNLNGYFYFTREVVEKMITKRTRGVIINVSSISAAGNMGQTSYAATKAAVNALTVSWAQELATFGIRVAGLSPGITDTPMPRSSMNEMLLNQWVIKTPLKRMADPKEMSEGIKFIFQNDFFCGRVLELDGGLRM